MLIVVHIYIWICTRCKSWRKIYLWLHISPYLFKTSGIRLHKFFSSLLLRRIKFITRQFFPSFHKSKSHDQSGTRRLLHGQREYDNRNDLQHGCYPRSRRIEKKKKKIWPTFPFLTVVVISSTIPFPLRKKYTSRNVFSSEGWKWIKARFVLGESKIRNEEKEVD